MAFLYKNFGTQIDASELAEAALQPGQTYNLKIEAATTTNARDSIKITGASAALSATNVGKVKFLDGTVKSITADVTINLTGAHWGAGTLGDLTGALLRVLAINDNGTAKWGVALLGGRQTLLTTDTSATATDINLAEEVLCNSAVASATNYCFEIGFVRADFDDADGAAEDLWAIQSGVNDVVTGRTADGLWQPWVTTPTGWDTAPVITTAVWSQVGRIIKFKIDAAAGTSTQTYARYTLPAKAHIIEFGPTVDVVNNTTNGGVGSWNTTAGSNVLNTVRTGNRADVWTASGSKRACPLGEYEVGPAASFID